MKAFVPSIGSSTQTYSASARSLPNSSPTIPCWGKFVRDQPAHHRFSAAVRLGDRIEVAPGLLVLDAERGAEEGQDGLAGRRGELFDEGGEVDDGHAEVLSE